jgi:hypothetical protein
MKVQICDHQNKSAALREAIISAGHEIVAHNANILLVDWDGPIYHYPRIIERAFEEGANVYVYSHGAMPITAWDGVWQPSNSISGYLAQSVGQKWVMETYGYPHPIHVIGWHYSEQRPFKVVNKIEKILFAPWHPHGDGWILPEGKALNTQIFENLLQLPYQVTARIIHSIEANGLHEARRVTFQESNRTISQSIEAIEQHDLVIAYGTLAYLAIALGKPTVVYGQDVCPQDGYSLETVKYVKSWDKYREYMRYPYDASNLGPLGMDWVMQQACQTEAQDWRERFIGKQFDPAEFVNLLERLLEYDQPVLA